VCGNLPGADRPDRALPGTDHTDPPAQEQPMKEITQELPGHIPDPRAEPVRETWSAGGKARLITLQNEETE